MLEKLLRGYRSAPSWRTVVYVVCAIVFCVSFGVFLGASCSGCATGNFREKLTTLDENNKPVVCETVRKDKVFWAPFSKSGPIGQKFKYSWGGKTNTITLGQDTGAVDTTGQTEAVRAIGGFLGDIAGEAIKAYLSAQTAGVTEAIPSGTAITGKITTLAELLKQLQALGLLKGTP